MRTKANTNIKGKKHNGFAKFTKVWSIIFLLSIGSFLYELIYADILPTKYLYMAVGGIAVIVLLIFPTLFSFRFKQSRKIIAFIFSIILIIVSGAGIVYLNGTLDFFSKVTTSSNEQFEEYYVIEKEDGAYNDIDQINGKTVNTYLTTEINYSDAKAQLQKKEDVQYEMIETLSALEDGLLKDDFELIFVSAAHYDTMCSQVTDFDEKTKILYTVKVKIESKDISKDVDVTKDPFNIYISGLDVEGDIDTASRSDVNMIVTVNPKTNTVLLTSIPRDYYVELTSKNGAKDKLTHTGIYGINETVASVEKLMNIDINYYVKVNYTTVVKLIDAIDGIDVTSDYTFTTSGMHIVGLDGLTFYEGENHLNGSEALAFARERHSFKDGDVQRNKNQQKIMKAILAKASSSSTLLTKYSTILNSIEENIELNMTSDDIKKLVKMQLDEMPSWNIKTQNLEGTGNTMQCYSTGDYLVYVMEPDAKSVVKALDGIVSVMEGNDDKNSQEKGSSEE